MLDTNSILTSIKKLLGIEAEDKNFDTDIIMHINTALMDLTQIGVGPEDGYFIQDESNTWEEFLGYSTAKVETPATPFPATLSEEVKMVKKMEAAKTCVYFKVKLAFDPPDSSAHIESLTRQIERLEWRLNVQAETRKKEG